MEGDAEEDENGGGEETYCIYSAVCVTSCRRSANLRSPTRAYAAAEPLKYTLANLQSKRLVLDKDNDVAQWSHQGKIAKRHVVYCQFDLTDPILASVRARQLLDRPAHKLQLESAHPAHSTEVGETTTGHPWTAGHLHSNR